MELNPITVEEMITATCDKGENEIDLRNCSFAEISGILRLVLLVKHLYAMGRRIKLSLPLDLGVQGYLERANAFIELKDICDIDTPIEHLRDRKRYPTHKLVELKPLEEEGQIPTIVECFSEGLKSHRNISNALINQVGKFFIETLQNIPHHADPSSEMKSYNGLAALQRYKGRICLSIGDLGVGIRRSLTTNPNFPPSKYNNAQAIEAAINGASRFNKIGRGGGLQSVVSTVKSLGGELFVRSADAIIEIVGDEQIIKNCTQFPGTQIDISVPLVSKG